MENPGMLYYFFVIHDHQMKIFDEIHDVMFGLEPLFFSVYSRRRFILIDSLRNGVISE